MDTIKGFIFAAMILAAMPARHVAAQCKFEEGKVVVVNHRGDWRHAAENSLEAFEESVNLGVNMVELDLNRTKDGELIILHDRTLDRTTTGHGSPADYTLAEIRQMRLKNGCGVTTAQTVPTLREVLLALKGKAWINIDKGYDYFDQVDSLLKETSTASQVVIKSWKPYATVAREHPAVLSDDIFMPIIDCADSLAQQHVEEYISKVHPVAFEINFATLTPAALRVIRTVRDAGSRVWLNALWPSLCAGMDDDRAVLRHQPDEAWGGLVRLGASFIQTDRPVELTRYLRERGLTVGNLSPEKIRAMLTARDTAYTFVVAHRGDWLRYPENSTGAFEGAIQLGADILETDVQRTKDGVLVISHDETIDRCTDGRGRIDGMTLAELRRYHLKDRNGNVTAYTMPTLEEAMRLCKGRIMVNLDKSDRFIDETMGVLRKTGTAQYAILKSYMTPEEVRKHYGQYLGEVLYMPAVNLDLPDAEERLKAFTEQMNPFAFEINFKVNEALAKRVHALTGGKSLVWLNSLTGRNLGHDDAASLASTEAGYGYMLRQYGVNIIQTDFPAYLSDYLKTMDRRR